MVWGLVVLLQGVWVATDPEWLQRLLQDIASMIWKCNLCSRWPLVSRHLPQLASPAKVFGSLKQAIPYIQQQHHTAGYPTRCALRSRSRLIFSIITEELRFLFTWIYLVSQHCAVRESVLEILCNMATNFAALHSDLLAVGRRTRKFAPMCRASMIKDHQLKLFGR